MNKLKLLILSILLLAAPAFSQSLRVTNNLVLQWDSFQTTDTGTVYNVYTATNMLPVTTNLSGQVYYTNYNQVVWVFEWQHLTSVPWTTNLAPVSYPIPVLPSDNQRFFVVAASNLLGETSFSEAVSLPALKRPGAIGILRAGSSAKSLKK